MHVNILEQEREKEEQIYLTVKTHQQLATNNDPSAKSWLETSNFHINYMLDYHISGKWLNAKCMVVAFEYLQNKIWLLRNVMINEKRIINKTKRSEFFFFSVSHKPLKTKCSLSPYWSHSFWFICWNLNLIYPHYKI